MKKFDLDFKFEPNLYGLHEVEIVEVSVKENSKGKYLDIECKVEGFEKVQHIMNNINDDTKNYVIAQLCNAGNQLRLSKMTSSELIKELAGKKIELSVTDRGFRIAPFKQLSIEEPKEV